MARLKIKSNKAGNVTSNSKKIKGLIILTSLNIILSTVVLVKLFGLI